jgi:glycerol-3-phosphate acyltransferase PlsX
VIVRGVRSNPLRSKGIRKEETGVATTNKVVRIAVDAMGGDHAPGEIVSGAVEAASSGGLQILLVGDAERVNAELVRHDADALPITIVPAEGVIEEGEQPARALRLKPRASVVISTGLVQKGLADAAVSLGSTGAAMAAAAVMLGTFEGIDRPAIGGPIMGVAPRTMVIDVGSNVDCRPSLLLSMGVIGDVFARTTWGIENPRVALLSVGGEVGKGNRQVREATELFEKSGLNFIGNVEANNIPEGKAEVVVADGFVGNVVMKLTEGLGAVLADRVRHRLKGKLAESEIEDLARDLFEVNNVAETFGGGPLLGVRGVIVLGHGRARADSVRRAIETAAQTVEAGFIPRLSDELDKARKQVGE